MKYFIDTEFLEGTQDIRVPFTNIKIGTTKPTIDLISIGIIAEDGREYYAISKDFNLKEAWNRFQWRRKPIYDGIPGAYKEYWIRDNVLKPIWEEKCNEGFTFKDSPMTPYGIETLFTYKNFKRLINKYGKTNKQIAEEIKYFVANRPIGLKKEQWILDYDTKNVHFYGYYSDYDWVVFCWLFGNMIDLPNGFPMYCIDVKQTLDEAATNKRNKSIEYYNQVNKDVKVGTWNEYLNSLKQDPRYPKQTNEHHALQDARWTKELYEFLNKL